MNFIKITVLSMISVFIFSCAATDNSIMPNDDDNVLTLFDAHYDVFKSYDIRKQNNYILSAALLEGYGYRSIISIKYNGDSKIYNIANNSIIKNADDLFAALVKSGKFMSGEKMLDIDKINSDDTMENKSDAFLLNLISLSQKGYFAILFIKDAFGVKSQISILKRQFSYDNGTNKTELPLYSVFPKPIHFAFGGKILFEKYIEASVKYKTFSFLKDFIADGTKNGLNQEEAVKNYINSFGTFTYSIIVPVKSISDTIAY